MPIQASMHAVPSLHALQMEPEEPGVEAGATHARGGTRSLAVVEYARAMRPALAAAEVALASAQPEDLEGVALLVQQALAEFERHEVDLMCSQKGSKVFERVLLLLEELALRGSSTELRQTCDDILNRLFRVATENAVRFATDFYASHSVQLLLRTAPIFLDKPAAAKEKTGGNDAPALSLEDHLLMFVNRVIQGGDDGGFGDLMCHACATHVTRACVSLLAGRYYTLEKLKFGIVEGGGRLGSPDGFLRNVPAAFRTLFADFAGKLVDAFADGGAYDYVTDTYGGAFLSFLFELAGTSDTLDYVQDALRPVAVSVVSQWWQQGAELLQRSSKPKHSKGSSKNKDSKVRLPPLWTHKIASRVIEAALPLLSESDLSNAVMQLVSKGDGVIRGLATDPCGNFVIQSFLRQKSLSAASCALLCQPLSVRKLLRRGFPGVVFRMLEACGRIPAAETAKQLAENLFDYLGVRRKTERWAWWSVLTLTPCDELPEQVAKGIIHRGAGADSTTAGQAATAAESAAAAGADSAAAAAAAAAAEFAPQPLGCSIMGALLALPATSVPAVHQGFDGFARNPAMRGCVAKLAVDRQGSYLMQAMMCAGRTALPEKRRRCVAGVVAECAAELAFHPVGSFVVAAAAAAAGDDARRLLFQNLLPVAARLQRANLKLCKVIHLDKALLEARTKKEKRPGQRKKRSDQRDGHRATKNRATRRESGTREKRERTGVSKSFSAARRPSAGTGAARPDAAGSGAGGDEALKRRKNEALKLFESLLPAAPAKKRRKKNEGK